VWWWEFCPRGKVLPLDFSTSLLLNSLSYFLFGSEQGRSYRYPAVDMHASLPHTLILLINSNEISSLILKIIVRDTKVMCWLQSDVLYIFISGTYYAGNYMPPVRWHYELSRFISCLLLLYKRIRYFQTGLPVDNCWIIACLRNIARFLRCCVYSLVTKIVCINNELL